MITYKKKDSDKKMSSYKNNCIEAFKLMGVPSSILLSLTEVVVSELTVEQLGQMCTGIERDDQNIKSWVLGKMDLIKREAADSRREVASQQEVASQRKQGGSKGSHEPYISPYSVSVFGGECAASFSIGKTGKVRLDTAYLDASGVLRNGRKPVLWYDKHVTTFTFDEASMWIAMLSGRIVNLIGPDKKNPSELYHSPANMEDETRVSCKHQGGNFYLVVRGRHETKTINDKATDQRVISIKRKPVTITGKKGEVVTFNHQLPIPIAQAPSLVLLFARSMSTMKDGDGLSIEGAIALSQSIYTGASALSRS